MIPPTPLKVPLPPEIAHLWNVRHGEIEACSLLQPCDVEPRRLGGKVRPSASLTLPSLPSHQHLSNIPQTDLDVIVAFIKRYRRDDSICGGVDAIRRLGVRLRP
jgi:hypothetical protein